MQGPERRLHKNNSSGFLAKGIHTCCSNQCIGRHCLFSLRCTLLANQYVLIYVQIQTLACCRKLNHSNISFLSLFKNLVIIEILHDDSGAFCLCWSFLRLKQFFLPLLHFIIWFFLQFRWLWHRGLWCIINSRSLMRPSKFHRNWLWDAFFLHHRWEWHHLHAALSEYAELFGSKIVYSPQF